jgi:predicted DNA-binding protein
MANHLDINQKGESDIIRFRIPKELHDWLKQDCLDAGMTRSEYLRECLEDIRDQRDDD